MQAIVLAAGYATRLGPLTERVAKPLLALAGRPMVDYIYDKVAEVDGIEALHLVTNRRFAAAFEVWARKTARRVPIHVHDDGTTSNADRRGAIGDLQFVIEQAKIKGQDLLVIAGDSLFDASLAEFAAYFRQKGEASAIALYECQNSELVKQYSAVEVDRALRITSFVEKPEAPVTSLVGTAIYLYHRRHVPMIDRYLSEGGSPDQPGRFVAWLHPRAPVFGYRLAGGWFDVGSPQELLAADNLLRKRSGMPERAIYALE
jgi:glucose-1-phosphate thymidylyltransferase